jgi:hypothetical protein
MSDVLVPDVRAEPWSHGATVIVDVSSLAHWLMKDVGRRVVASHLHAARPGDPPQVRRSLIVRGFHRIVDVLAHHGVQTGHLMLSTTLGAFPPDSTGWRPSKGQEDADPKRRQAIAAGEALVRSISKKLRPRGITVTGLPGMFGTSGEHCVDELCVLAAVHASWTSEEDRDIIVISRDADVAIAPLLAGPGRILLARRMVQQDANELAERLKRHGSDPDEPPLPPAHLRLLITALRDLLRPEDLPEGRLRDALAALPPEDVPPVELAEVNGEQVLRNAHARNQMLSSSLDVPTDRTWYDRRRALLDAGVRATAIVDPFGLLATANRCGVAGRIPTASSVAEALAPLGLPRPLGQLAVIPDLLDLDHGLIAIATQIDGVQVVPRMRDVLTERVRADLIAMDERLESSLDSYEHDELPETVATASQFARTSLSAIGVTAQALEEKESGVLLAADLLWVLMFTDGPVVLMSDRPDLVALLDVIGEHFVGDPGMNGRVSRVGLQADPFSAEGIAVDRSGSITRWPTALLTGQMIADLLRLGGAPEGGVESGAARSGPDDDGSSPTDVAEAIAYDPVLHSFTVKDLDGRRAGEVSLRDIIQFPVDGVSLMALDDEASAMTLRTLLAASLRLHLDLRVPLPSARLTRRSGTRLVEASIVSGRVVGHRDGGVVVRVTSRSRSGEVVEARTSDLAAVPASGAVVEIVVTHDGEHCRLVMPDLSDVPDAVGRPRPARVVAGERVVLLEPLDPRDARDDTGQEMRARTLLGPYPTPAEDEVVMVTQLDAGVVQIVSTSLPWVDAMGS